MISYFDSYYSISLTPDTGKIKDKKKSILIAAFIAIFIIRLIIEFRTKITPDTGLVLVNINDVLAAYDMQLSARTAASVAGKP